MLLIGGVVGLVIGAGLTIFYFSLTTFFRVHARTAHTFETNQRAAENGSENARVATPTEKGRGVGA
jgi:hypothetical protein